MSKIKQLISVDCEKSPKREVCGFVVFEDDEYKILPAENKSPNKENEFYIPAKDFLYVKNTKNVVAIYHSHAQGNSEPSEFDKKTCDLICYPFVIYSIETNTFNILKPKYMDADHSLVKKLEEEIL
jgi:proteasome lid subunit RPN8/RPN11